MSTSRSTFRTAEPDLTMLLEQVLDAIKRYRVVAALKQEVSRKRVALQKAQRGTSEARRAFLTLATAYDEQRGKLLEERALLQQAGRLVDNAERAWRASENLTESLSQLGTDIDDSYKRQEAAR